MTGNLNMGNKKIKNLKDPVNYQDAAKKNYVEVYVGVIESYLLPKDGSEAMQGNLDMNNNGIKNLKDPVIRTLEPKNGSILSLIQKLV